MLWPVAAFVLAIMAPKAACMAEEPPLVLERIIPLPNVSGRIDHMAIDLDRHLLPLNGTREGLFLAPFLVIDTTRSARPAILLPNPFYQCYAAAVLAAGASGRRRSQPA